MQRFMVLGLFSSIYLSVSLRAANVTVASNPAGSTIIVDGASAVAPHTFTWTAGSSHNLSVSSPQGGAPGTRYVFSSWSDDGGQSHTVTVPASDITYTVAFTTQNLLTVTASPPGAGTFRFIPPSPDGYYNASGSVSVLAQADPAYIWTGWSGDLAGALFVPLVVSFPMNQPRHVVGLFLKPVGITMSHTSLNFGSTIDGALVTSPQTVTFNFSAASAVSWTTLGDPPNITVSPASGIGNVSLQVSVNGIPTCPAFPRCNVSITATSATEEPNQKIVPVNVVAARIGPSYGSFDTPEDNAANISGSIPVTGWALDSIEVSKVDIWREPLNGEAVQSNGLVYIGDAAFVPGARPDVDSVYPLAPLNYRAGWGYLLLTNVLPNHGNGTFRLHAIAHNKAGISTDLGIHTIFVDNAHASKPFGSIDTPGPGDTIAGNAYINFGWALTPGTAAIPADGSTITVMVDGAPLGHPTYNQYRMDIANGFPGYANSNGAVGFFYLDTTRLENGMHTIAWSVYDNAGHAEGIGSRYFTVQNSGTGSSAAPDAPIELPARNVIPQLIEIEELGRIELRWGAVAAYLRVNGENRPLPVGSSIQNGVLYWQTGVGFLGEYDLVLVRADGVEVPVRVRIQPKRFAPASN
jgi:hypothetical protein